MSSLEVMGGGGAIIKPGLQKIFPGRFLADLYIYQFNYISGPLIQEEMYTASKLWIWGPLKSNPKARKLSASKFIKETFKKMRGRLSFEGCQMKIQAATLNFCLNDRDGQWTMDIP
jgi:hypothetical protein